MTERRQTMRQRDRKSCHKENRKRERMREGNRQRLREKQRIVEPQTHTKETDADPVLVVSESAGSVY